MKSDFTNYRQWRLVKLLLVSNAVKDNLLKDKGTVKGEMARVRAQATLPSCPSCFLSLLLLKWDPSCARFINHFSQTFFNGFLVENFFPCFYLNFIQIVVYKKKVPYCRHISSEESIDMEDIPFNYMENPVRKQALMVALSNWQSPIAPFIPVI